MENWKSKMSEKGNLKERLQPTTNVNKKTSRAGHFFLSTANHKALSTQSEPVISKSDG